MASLDRTPRRHAAGLTRRTRSVKKEATVNQSCADEPDLATEEGLFVPPRFIFGESEQQRTLREGVTANNRKLGGRRLKLTPEFVDAMVNLVERGNPPARAAVLLHISEPTYYRWMAKGGEQTRGKFREFHDRIESARAMGEAYLVSVVRAEAITKPELAFKMLTRMNPRDWAAKSADWCDPHQQKTHEHQYDIAFARAVNEDPDAARLALELLGKVETRREVHDSGQPRLVSIKRALGSGGTS